MLISICDRGAGSDSTASTMQSFFWLMLNSVKTYENVLAEIDEAHRTGKMSTFISYPEAQGLSYFQACLLEAMRLRPAVGLNIYRHVPPGGLEIDGHFYPENTEIALNGWVLHRDKEIFGQDADRYRPERWLQANAKDMHRHMYQVSKHWLSSTIAELTSFSSVEVVICALDGISR